MKPKHGPLLKTPPRDVAQALACIGTKGAAATLAAHANHAVLAPMVLAFFRERPELGSALQAQGKGKGKLEATAARVLGKQRSAAAEATAEPGDDLGGRSGGRGGADVSHRRGRDARRRERRPPRAAGGGGVRLAHPARTPGLVERWSALLGDYEIVQPLEQLGRAVRAPTPAEEEGERLDRTGAIAVPARKLLGTMEARGWRRTTRASSRRSYARSGDGAERS